MKSNAIKAALRSCVPYLSLVSVRRDATTFIGLFIGFERKMLELDVLGTEGTRRLAFAAETIEEVRPANAGENQKLGYTLWRFKNSRLR